MEDFCRSIPAKMMMEREGVHYNKKLKVCNDGRFVSMEGFYPWKVFIHGRFVSKDVLDPWAFRIHGYPWTFCIYGRFVGWTFCRLDVL
jgi:hypothetical protein